MLRDKLNFLKPREDGNDKKKIESLDEKTRDYESGFDELDTESLLDNDEAIAMDKRYRNVPVGDA